MPLHPPFDRTEPCMSDSTENKPPAKASDKMPDKAEVKAAPEHKAAPATPTGMQRPPKGQGEVRRRRSRLILSFIFCVLLPSCLGGVYYSHYASDRYATGASFVVRGFDGGGGGDLVSSFTGLTSSGSTTADSYIIRRYLHSGDLLLLLESQGTLSLQEHYSDPAIDLISRFNSKRPFEEFVDYWSRRILTTYDSTTGILTFEVQAFDADTTLVLANAILEAADTLVNELSAEARQDSLSFAIAEVERAEVRLRAAQLKLQQFRSSTGTADPLVNAQLDAELIAGLEAQVADLAAQIDELSQNVAAGAPILLQLERRQAAIRAQINERRAAVGVQSDGTTSADNLGIFEELQIEQTFAQQRYASALTSLEQARMDSDRLQRYLAVFANPLPPQDAIYPRRVRNMVLVVVASFVFWVIATLVTYAVRDHLR